MAAVVGQHGLHVGGVTGRPGGLMGEQHLLHVAG